ncbi:MAG: hypothetical protein KDA22_12080 [Phycisphaerales bacterium]|nr:hypothetical protein [Phycisphaerales bacterium]
MNRSLRWIVTASAVCLGAPTMAQQPNPGAATGGSGGDKFPWVDAASAPEAPPATNAPAGTGGADESALGAIAVRVIQGTPDGPPLGAMPLDIELYHRGQLIDTISTATDEHGVVLAENLPVGIGIQPIVRTRYGDLTYQVEGGVMDAAHRHQQIDLVCYEPTDQAPDWRVKMRHVIVDQIPIGLRVTEVMVIENPAERTWIGAAGFGPKRVTTAFLLPKGARDVTLGQGFHDWCCSTLANGALMNHLPLMPATTEMRYSYVLPAEDGHVTLDISAPAEVDSTMVLVPESLVPSAVRGVEAAGTQPMGDGGVRFYAAGGMQAGARATIEFAGLRGGIATASGALPATPGAAAEGAARTAATGGAERMAKIVAITGGALLLLIGFAVILLVRRGKRSSPASEHPA